MASLHRGRWDSGVNFPAKFRKKPVVVTAIQVTRLNVADVASWCDGLFNRRDYAIDIMTREGLERAEIGDFVVCGIEGEFYPVKSDIFWKTYEAAEVVE